jgi:hypothetical protein
MATKIYKTATKYTKCQQNIPKSSKIGILTYPIASPSKIYPNWNFGMKICHLATLVCTYVCIACREQKRKFHICVHSCLHIARY